MAERKKQLLAKINKRKMLKRQRKVKHVLNSLLSRDELALIGNQKTLPQIQLWTASYQYVYGFFENSVLDSAFAAEYGLLLRLNEKLNEEEKKIVAIRGLSFSDAIKRSRKEHLIGESLAQELLMLCHLRNMAAHPSNYVVLFKQIIENDPMFTGKPLKNWIADTIGMKTSNAVKAMKTELDKKALSQALDTLLAYKDKQFGNLPDLEWAAHHPTLKAQVPIVKKYSQKIVKDMLLEKALLNLAKKPTKATDFIIDRYSYIEDIALDTIEIAFNTLKQLNFIND